MHSRLLIAALVLVGVVAAAAPQATSRTAGSPKIYLRIAGYRASVDLSPAGTLLNDACSTYCGFSFPPGTTTVRLTAHPAPGSSFVGWVQAFNGWTPPCTGNARTCYINLRTSVAIKAAFNPVSLSWHSSSGGGTVEFLDARPSCGFACRLYDYDAGAHVVAHADEGYAFSSWSNACGSNPSCGVRMNGNGNLGANFRCTDVVCKIEEPITNPVTVRVQVSGHGRVLGSHFNCPAVRCSATVEFGTILSLAASPTSGSQFQGWYVRGPACATHASRCTFPVFKDSRVKSPLLIAYFS